MVQPLCDCHESFFQGHEKPEEFRITAVRCACCGKQSDDPITMIEALIAAAKTNVDASTHQTMVQISYVINNYIRNHR